MVPDVRVVQEVEDGPRGGGWPQCSGVAPEVGVGQKRAFSLSSGE